MRGRQTLIFSQDAATAAAVATAAATAAAAALAERWFFHVAYSNKFLNTSDFSFVSLSPNGCL